MKKAILAIMLSIFVLGLWATAAMADSILFPWISKGPTVLTLISVVNTSDRETLTSNSRLHYEYYWKDATSPTANTNCCQVQSILRNTSINDLVSFDASGLINAGKPLFNDNDFDTIGLNYGNNGFHNSSATQYARAFLIVDNNDTENFENSTEASLYGEAMVIELSQGAAWGYIAYNGSGGGPFGPGSGPLSFSDGFDMQGEVMRSPRYFDDASDGDELETTPAIMLPLSSFQTKIYVTPVNYALAEYGSGPGTRNTCSNSRVEFCLDPRPADGVFPIGPTCASPLGGISLSGENCQTDPDGECRHIGIYDNDETALDGGAPVDVVCTTALSLSTDTSAGGLLTTAQISYLETMEGTQPTGGNAWGYVRSMVGSFFPPSGLGQRNVNTESDSIIGKLQYSDSIHPASIGGVSIPNALNDFEWIRNSSSQVDGAWELKHGINNVIQDDGFGD